MNNQQRQQELSHQDYCRIVGQVVIDCHLQVERLRGELRGMAAFVESLQRPPEGDP